jgi:hypothetical protein
VSPTKGDFLENKFKNYNIDSDVKHLGEGKWRNEKEMTT